MKNIRLTLAYDGGPYLGWQHNGKGLSIEGELKKQLSKILQQEISLQAASRTDAGVHAHGQIVNFFLENENVDLNLLCYSLNQLLPKSIVIIDLQEMPLTFHPTLDQKGKCYHYYLCCGKFQWPEHAAYSWHVGRLNDLFMKEAAINFLGTHDFSSFCNKKTNEVYKDHIRTVTKLSFIQMDENRLCIKIEGLQFLYKMVRNIVGTLVDVGREKILPSSITSILEKKDRKLAGVTAPAHGLFLNSVSY